MQAQHLTIIALLVPLSWALLTYFIWHGFLRGKKVGYASGQNHADVAYAELIESLHDNIEHLSNLYREEQIKRLNEVQQSEARISELRDQVVLIKAAPFTASDIKILVEAAQTLSLALRTWDAIRGTESVRARAISTQRSITELAARMKNAVDAADAFNETAGNHQKSSTQHQVEGIEQRGMGSDQ